jgi:thymidine kinase
MSGYLEMIIGPMFSGKTSRILEIYRKAKYCNTEVFVINHSIDNRYSTNEVVNHNNERIPCSNYNMLSEFINFLEKKENDYLKYTETIVLINEAQFFKDVKSCVIQLVEKFNFKVYVCGLDGDFKRNQFGNFLELIPYSNKIIKLNSLCFKCKNGNEAPFTYRYNNKNNEQIMVGSNESYIPLCRICYLKM